MEPPGQGRLRKALAAGAVLAAASVPAATGTAADPDPACLQLEAGRGSPYALCGGRVLLASGRTWRDVTPRLPRLGPLTGPLVPVVHDAVFVDRRHGWVASNECVASKAFVSRTADAGRTWRTVPVPPTNCSAGSRLDLFFLDRRRGWLSRMYLTGPGQHLSRTTDGGRTWRPVLDDLPALGTVVFRTDLDGWLAREEFLGGALYATRDGGRTWRRRAIDLPRGWEGARVLADAPRFFGARGVLPVDLERAGRAAVAFYVTADGGRTWRIGSLRPVTFRLTKPRSPFPRYVPVSVASLTAWWVVSGEAKRTVHVTSDGGHRWSVRTLPVAVRTLPVRAVSIAAADARRAWVVAEAGLLATMDAGRSWRRVDLP